MIHKLHHLKHQVTNLTPSEEQNFQLKCGSFKENVNLVNSSARDVTDKMRDFRLLPLRTALILGCYVDSSDNSLQTFRNNIALPVSGVNSPEDGTRQVVSKRR